MLNHYIQYVGVNDHTIDLFEGQYRVPGGMSYNSYMLMDEKIAVFDTVDAAFGEEWLQKVAAALGDRQPDYLIVQHMEPDHSANIARFLSVYPEATVVATDKAFVMMGKYFGGDIAPHRLVVKDGDTLSLGEHTLAFYTAPMVHWPEVMLTYDREGKTLFSADAFGKFGALDTQEDWVDEARRYYIGIVGKYGAQVQAVFKKIGALAIETICPLHGPVLTEDLGKYLGLYQTWSTYTAEHDGVVIAYTSVYGNTKKAVEQLEKALVARGVEHVHVFDLARADMSQAVAVAFAAQKLVLATTTYNGDIFPFMREFIHHLTERGYQNRTVGMIENGSWAPLAAKKMAAMLEGGKNLQFTDTVVTVHAAVNENTLAQIEALADELA